MPDDEKELRKALTAFKKRLKLQQLEQDSRLGRSPLTGAKERIVAIQPPSGFGRATWERLAELGYLKYDGGGMYLLTDKPWAAGPETPPATPG